MDFSRRELLAGSAATTMLAPTTAQAKPPQAKVFRDFLASHVKTFKSVGAALAVQRGSAVIFEGYVGPSDLESRTVLGASSLFPVASVGKAVTGTAALLLVENGQLDLDAPVQRYLPDFPTSPHGLVTSRTLLAHLSGMRHYRDDERTDDRMALHFDGVQDALTLFKTDAYSGPPGKYLYSSYGYNLLAAVIEKASGKRFDDYVRTHIFEPIGLRRTRFDDSRFPIAGRVKGYSYYYPWFSFSTGPALRRAPQWDYSYNAGGGNLLMSARDLLRFGSAFLRPGLFPAKLIASTRKPLVQGASSWSYGWMVSESSLGPRLKAEGSVPGHQASITLFPEKGIAVALLDNAWGLRPATPPKISDPVLHVAEIAAAL